MSPQNDTQTPAATPPAQPELFGFSAVQMVPQGGGEWRLKACKPIRWLTPAEFGAAVGLSADSIYRYRAQGWIAAEHVRRCGITRLQIDAAAVPLFLARSEQAAADKAADREAVVAEQKAALGPTFAILA